MSVIKIRSHGLTIYELGDSQKLETDEGTEEILANETTPTKYTYASIFSQKPGQKLKLHYHDIEEVQYIISGTGVYRDIAGNEHPVKPGMIVYCSEEREGAHEVENTGTEPLVIFCALAPHGGKFPRTKPVAFHPLPR